MLMLMLMQIKDEVQSWRMSIASDEPSRCYSSERAVVDKLDSPSAIRPQLGCLRIAMLMLSLMFGVDWSMLDGASWMHALTCSKATRRRMCWRAIASRDTYRSGRAVDGGAESSSRAVEQVGHVAEEKGDGWLTQNDDDVGKG